MKLTLQQIKELHKAEGCNPLSVEVHGHVDLIIKNADGSVDQVVSKPNLATHMWNDWWHSRVNLRQLRVFIAPEDNGDVHILKTFTRHLYPENYEVDVYSSLNSTTNTWTYTAVFSPPSSNRTIRYIGLHGGGIGGDNTARAVQCIFAMTKLTSNILQTTSQTLEVVYRVSFSRA